jgi:hypothetical protein
MTTITQERAALANVGQRLRTREQAGFRRSYTDARTVVEPATRVFVHITVTNPRNYGSDDAHARAVESIGISRFPSTGISYNRLVMQSGTAYEGQPVGRRGAHTVNDFKRAACSTAGCPGRGAPLTAPDWNLNYNARAYVICQNVADVVTDKQLNSLAKAIAADKLAGFVIRTAEIHGHRCVSSKSCPAGPMWARMSALEILVNNYLRTGLSGAKEDDMTVEELLGTTIHTGQGDFKIATLLANASLIPAVYAKGNALAAAIAADDANDITLAQIDALFEEKLKDAVVQVDINVAGQEPEPPVPA